ncbi:MAG: hypothetical protein JXA23_07680 [Bacteroidales bacterium]|nr:hypothetical protein [Bacteroidales bacterium]
MTHATGCLICGDPIRYTELEKLLTCNFCGNSFHSNASCVHGHFICDDCHAIDAVDVIFHICLEHTGSDPVALADRILQHPSVKMHGPEHHFLVPAVLISCYYSLQGNPEQKRTKLESARKRSSHVLGGFCGSHGTCGAAIGTGIFLSLILDSTPLKTQEWRLSNLMTARALTEIAHLGGPRCCKRDTWIAIRHAAQFLQSEWNVTMETSRPSCGFSERNHECLEEGCLFFRTKDEGRKTKDK